MFNFNTLVKPEKQSELKVFVNSQPFNNDFPYREAKELVIHDKHGEIKIENCKISNLKQTEFAEIEKYSVNFNEKFVKLNEEKQNFFIKTNILIELFNLTEEELQIEDLND